MRPKLLLLQSMCGLAASLAVLTVLPACHPSDLKSGHASTTAAPTSVTPTTAVAAPPTTRNPRSEKWIDLQVGDCLAELPPSDPSVVTVTVVDCATAHAAEVYLRGPLAVNAAVTDVANRECASGFPGYTGQSVDGSSFAVTYLIDSDQDRTSDNPAPSTVICLLHAANGRPLTESARR
jgi:hypothetical protein